MFYRLSADLVLIVHLAFILFVILGGLLVLRRPRLVWLHLPAVVWGTLIEFHGRHLPYRADPRNPDRARLRRAPAEHGHLRLLAASAEAVPAPCLTRAMKRRLPLNGNRRTARRFYRMQMLNTSMRSVSPRRTLRMPPWSRVFIPSPVAVFRMAAIDLRVMIICLMLPLGR
jgi:hypothetical protein